MANQSVKAHEKHIEYSKTISSILCSTATLALLFLSMLNSGTVDLYALYCIVKVVIPGAFCFWFIGKVIGIILDKYTGKIAQKKKENEKKAYEIKSMFCDDEAQDSEIKNDDGLDIL